MSTPRGDVRDGIMTELINLVAPPTVEIELPPPAAPAPPEPEAQPTPPFTIPPSPSGGWVVRTGEIPVQHVCDTPMTEVHVPGQLLSAYVVDGHPGEVWRCWTCYTLYVVVASPLHRTNGTQFDHLAWQPAGRKLQRKYRLDGYPPGVDPRRARRFTSRR
jgi:hypothetical protein